MADYDLSDETQVKEYLRNVETEYSFQCMSEKDPEGCYRLADFLFSVKREEKLGSKLFRKNCDEMRHAASCFKHAGMVAMGIGGEFDGPEDATKYFIRACDFGLYRGCANAGMMYLRGYKSAQDTQKGVKLLQKACDNTRGEACGTLGVSYLMGSNRLVKDTTKAFHFLTKGCKLGDYQSCFNLSRMYKLGDGVEKNLKVASQYAEEAKQIKQKLTGHDAVNVSMGRKG